MDYFYRVLMLYVFNLKKNKPGNYFKYLLFCTNDNIHSYEFGIPQGCFVITVLFQCLTRTCKGIFRFCFVLEKIYVPKLKKKYHCKMSFIAVSLKDTRFPAEHLQAGNMKQIHECQQCISSAKQVLHTQHQTN